ncbi:UBP-type zinc finger domain-containing protein [Streptomyces sp. NPDC127038]|uniref:UBP-type zinc finger domain-containing protein n=1 Tax=Streptomyces sp. NPDC127038 TaxID=3347114 RepID=UPI003666EFB1
MTEWVVQPDGGRPEGRDCLHAAEAGLVPTPRSRVCPECLSQGREETRLRVCLTCGHIGCSDSAPGAHAYAHYASSGHPVARSMEPSGEPWAWCYVDELFLRLSDGHSTE